MKFLLFLKNIIIDEKRGLLYIYQKKHSIPAELYKKISKKDAVLNLKRIILFALIIFIIEAINLSTIFISNSKMVLYFEYCIAGGLMLLLTGGTVLLEYSVLNKNKVSLHFHRFLYRSFWILFSILMLIFVYLEITSQDSYNNYIYLLILTATFPVLSLKEATGLFILDMTSMVAIAISHGSSPRQLLQISMIAFFSWVLSRMLYNAHQTNDIMLEQLEISNKKLNALAKTDSLTGLLNRRGIEVRLYDILLQFDNPVNVAFLMVDIDLFKQYNDSFGHDRGDNCLTLVAKAIRSCTQGENEFAARYGGEEFLIVIVDCNENQALEMARKINRQIRKLKIEAPNSEVNRYVTASLGVAVMETPLDFLALYKKADCELYNAKNHGRNCVSMNGIIDNK